jgi:hypothetical protein
MTYTHRSSSTEMPTGWHNTKGKALVRSHSLAQLPGCTEINYNKIEFNLKI